jgi:hypothetical protein
MEHSVTVDPRVICADRAADVDNPDAVSVAVTVAAAPAAAQAAVTKPVVLTVAIAVSEERKTSPEAGSDFVEPSL